MATEELFMCGLGAAVGFWESVISPDPAEPLNPDSNEQALTRVMSAMEALGDKELKKQIQHSVIDEPPAVQDAIRHGVNVVDPKKTPDPGWKRLLVVIALGLVRR